MSTDDSISEDVSSSVALSHDHTSPNGGKESEASVVSSADTVSGLVLPEEAAVMTRPSSTPACTISSKIRSVMVNCGIFSLGFDEMVCARECVCA